MSPIEIRKQQNSKNSEKTDKTRTNGNKSTAAAAAATTAQEMSKNERVQRSSVSDEPENFNIDNGDEKCRRRRHRNHRNEIKESNILEGKFLRKIQNNCCNLLENNLFKKIKSEIYANDGGDNDDDDDNNVNDDDDADIHDHRNVIVNEENNDINRDEIFDSIDEMNRDELYQNFVINIKIDLVTILLFTIAFCTRIYKLSTPNNIVFDELHYGKYVSLYMKNIFFFDQHPPFGKQLIAGIAHLTGYDGNYTFSRIGSQYTANVPIFWLRFIPALCGSLLSPVVYKLLLEVKLNRWTSLLGGILIILDNSLLTQSRFILMESMLLLFSTLALLFLLRYQKSHFGSFKWLIYGILSATFFTFALSVKYVGIYSCFLGFFIMLRYLWNLLLDKRISDLQIIIHTIIRWLMFTIIPIAIYMTIFYIHLSILYKAGPHDSVMTSAFQASLDGGLASITKGQPLNVVHGSQITLRHTHGRTCWLHSHAHVYPIRYPDKRGSSHQQQVTCYSFKDVNNWWIIKRPVRDDLVVGEDPDPIRHGDMIQLVHGITSRALNSHDVAAPMSPQSQEVSCYIDYNVSMPGQLLWKLDILNRETEGPIWHAIRSQIRLIHVDTGYALRFSGRQLPEWGFNQHEIVADRIIEQQDTIWNVEEHRYTKTEDQKERERQLLNAEMIPTRRTYFSFWDKFIELQSKMLWYTEPLQSHMYSSEPLEWPLLDKGIAYWVDKNSNGQIHLLGNIIIWYSGTIAILLYLILLIFYLIRRRRLCYDIPKKEWKKFQMAGEIFLGGYFIHYLPYYFVERTLFLHNYLPAFLFKLFILCFIIEHIDFVVKRFLRNSLGIFLYRFIILLWILTVVIVYRKFLALSYGIIKLQSDDIVALRWKDTWDFILQRDLP